MENTKMPNRSSLFLKIASDYSRLQWTFRMKIDKQNPLENMFVCSADMPRSFNALTKEIRMFSTNFQHVFNAILWNVNDAELFIWRIRRKKKRS